MAICVRVGIFWPIYLAARLGLAEIFLGARLSGFLGGVSIIICDVQLACLFSG
jgi:hypothetical protein